MMFMRTERPSKQLRTNAERCAQVGALFGTILVIITAVLLYFGITTEHSEQKSVYFIVSVINIAALIALIGLTIYYVRRFIIKDEINKAYESNNNPNMRYNYSHTKLNMQQQQQAINEKSIYKQSNSSLNKANYALNQPVPIVMTKSVSATKLIPTPNTAANISEVAQPTAITHNLAQQELNYGYYKI